MELDRPVRLGWHMVRVAQPRTFKRPTVLIVRAVADTVSLDVAIPGETSQAVSIDAQGSLVVAGMHGVRVVAGAGAWRYQRIPVSPLAKLLAFLEGGFGGCASPERREAISLIDDADALSAGRIESWIVARAVERDERVEALFELLRTDESYGLVRFLLRERLNFKSVSELSRQYGVSESHFRRLCRQALGTNLKGELRRWRAADAILGIVEGRESLTRLAIGSGYSSSSHLSKDVKDFLGFSPCKIRQDH
ncbi:transcriptional regulator, AraC family [Burkholderia ambifaria IOP40-10]|uniref:Transcriptional regulator, AraC family n=1 Tax=Burkholderia ambifaria IOP40-10 TaxID=396596 RepID=B1FB86_9BURK|nr:helix-turn-helix domain-containing protein [Burkholderia ambifaria]EDT05168.1 transcriptional regulator, AraC family [Burkholderia ambifaria IOP40-10]